MATAAELNEEAWALRITDRARASELAERALETAEAAQDESQIAYACRNLAFLETFRAASSTTVVFARRAVELFDKLGDAEGKASALDSMATFYEMIGDYPSALEHALQVRDIAVEIGDRKWEGWALSSIGGTMLASGDYDGAFDRFTASLRLFEDLDYEIGQARLHGRLGELQQKRGNLDDALAHFRAAHAALRNSDLNVGRGMSLAAIGSILAERGDLATAQQHYAEAQALLGTDARPALRARIQLRIGLLHAELGDVEVAREALESALALATEGQARHVIRDAHVALSDAFEEAGEPQAALEHLRAAMRQAEEISGSETAVKLKRIEIRAEIDSAQKDAEIQRLRYVELKGMQAELVESEKIAVLGNLMGGIAHEINTPLGVLKSNVDLVRRALPRVDTKVARALEGAVKSVSEATERIDDLVRNLRRFMHLDEAEVQSVDVRAGLESALGLLFLPDHIKLETSLEDVPQIRGRPAELNQAFLVLLQNASEAIEAEGTVTVQTRSGDDEVIVSIADDGRGIPADQLETLFDVQVGAKGHRIRLRLGLAMVASVVRRHGGRIDVSSSVGEGSTFTIRLPMSWGGSTADLAGLPGR